MIQHRKAVVQHYLKTRDFEGLKEWAEEERGSVRVLGSLILDLDPLVRWRAIEGLGKVCGTKAKSDLKSVRRVIRRLFWGMNDESGNLIWSAPEAIAEILVNVPRLIDDYAPLLPPLMDLEPFPRGVSWALARLSAVRPKVFENSTEVLLESLSSSDPHIRGCGLRTLGQMQFRDTDNRIPNLSDDGERYEWYDPDTGEMSLNRVADDYARVINRNGCA
jgi:hypothetical protein